MRFTNTYKLIILLVTLYHSSLFAQQKLKYGTRASLNLSTIGTQYGKYNGGGNYSAGIFFNYKPIHNLSVSFEPTYIQSGFREKQTDSKYTYQHLDFNINTYLPLFSDDALMFYLGIRPSYLLNFKSETLNNGNYVRTNLNENKNENGQLEFGINAGFAVQLSPVVNFELGYMYNVTDNNNNTQLKGRPSLIEITLKLNVVDLAGIIENKEKIAKEQIKNYKSGVLLVMLPTLTNEDLLKIKDEGDRSYAKNELKIRNIKVINEFLKGYTFTPVYFFADTNVNKVVSGNLEGIFIDRNLKVDTSIKPVQSENILIASFCNDLYNYSEKISYGLFVYDSKLKQLPKPYTVPSQMFGLYTDGDPMNYFKTKRINYTNMPFDRMIKKLNSRMLRYANF